MENDWVVRVLIENLPLNASEFRSKVLARMVNAHCYTCQAKEALRILVELRKRMCSALIYVKAIFGSNSMNHDDRPKKTIFIVNHIESVAENAEEHFKVHLCKMVKAQMRCDRPNEPNDIYVDEARPHGRASRIYLIIQLPVAKRLIPLISAPHRAANSSDTSPSPAI